MLPVRAGKYGSTGISVVPPVICATNNRAVASEVVIPRPSCPVARYSVESSGHGPIKGSLSGVAARNPVHTRIAEVCASAGM